VQVDPPQQDFAATSARKVASTADVSPIPLRQPLERDRHWLQWLANWKIWLVLALLICSGSIAFALALLFRLPGLPNCPTIFWPLATAGMRFECARLAASKQTAKDLLEAIALVDSLPPDHPLREEANRLVEQWSEDVLRLAEEAFHAGKLAVAIEDARKIPTKTSAYKLVEERVKRWETIWAKAEALYRQAEAALRERDWRKAFLLAVRLLNVENNFWQTTRYEELDQRINTARLEGDKLVKADRLADGGTLEELLEAIKLAQSIAPKSYVYDAAQKAIVKFGRMMLDLAQDALDRRDLQTALTVIGKIPDLASLKEEILDFTALAYAQSEAWKGTVPFLEAAIAQAQRISSSRPLYKKAQQFATRWQLEIEGVAQLEKARILAQSGSIADLSAAIAQASAMTESNPRWSEAQKEIRTWTNQIQELEDRPLLEQAELIASRGDVAALQAAIAQASRIAPKRTLRREAQTKIQQWTDQIERFQDQPYLDQARVLANNGNLAAAVEMAGQIKSGRVLYAEAQAEMRTWRKTLQAQTDQAQAQQDLQDAIQLASTNTPESLAAAIQKVESIKSTADLRSQADNLIDTWSRQLLQLAEAQLLSNVKMAIAIAQKIPAKAPVYGDAQRQIADWKKLLSSS
jgi:hypothetical protein